MKTLWAVLIVVSAAPAFVAAQIAPDPAPGSTHTMVRAAGMPLRDGELPPGTLTVRVVGGDFSNNLADQTVRLEVTGHAVSTARTGADGRASFAHLPVGAYVTVSAVVDDEPLRSEAFQMPAESGIRVLLVAGAGAPVAPVGWTAADAAPPSVSQIRDFSAAATFVDSSGVTVVRTVLACTTGFVGMLFVLRWRRRIALRAPTQRAPSA
jgi:hypothetical protein